MDGVLIVKFAPLYMLGSRQILKNKVQTFVAVKWCIFNLEKIRILL
jgi:hypothetical protein